MIRLVGHFGACCLYALDGRLIMGVSTEKARPWLFWFWRNGTNSLRLSFLLYNVFDCVVLLSRRCDDGYRKPLYIRGGYTRFRKVPRCEKARAHDAKGVVRQSNRLANCTIHLRRSSPNRRTLRTKKPRLSQFPSGVLQAHSLLELSSVPASQRPKTPNTLHNPPTYNLQHHPSQ